MPRSLRRGRCMVIVYGNVLKAGRAQGGRSVSLNAPDRERLIQASNQFLVTEWLGKKADSTGPKCFSADSRCRPRTKPSGRW